MKKIIKYILSLFFIVGSTHLKSEDPLTLMQQEIKHIVIVMMENRSFDNMAAWLYDDNNPPLKFIPHHTDPYYLGLSEKTLDQYVNHLKNSQGKIVYTCSPIRGIPSASSTPYLNSPKFDPNEPFPNVNIQIFGNEESIDPLMTGFLQDYASLWPEFEWEIQKDDICAVMETYTDKELPVFSSLARHYAISDYWFSSVPTQTNPNRAFAFCGTSEGEIINGSLGKNNFNSDTIWNRLNEQAPDTTWAIFWQSDMLTGIYSGPYSGPNNFQRIKNIPNFEEHFLKIDQFHQLATSGQLPDISFLEPQWTLSLNLSFEEKETVNLLSRGHDFIVGLQGNDFHPPGDMRTGENFLANIYTSLIANQEAWSKTLLIVTFDEHGGLFDHLPPPAAISPDDYCQHGFHFDRYGVRIPTLLISPKINKGIVFRADDPTLPFDHTSLIAMLLKWKNVPRNYWNMGKRVEAAPTFETIFESSDARMDPVLNDNLDLNEETEETMQMGDLFYLKDPEGNYLKTEELKYLFGIIPYKQTTNLVLTFDGSTGSVMHGSFVVIKSPRINSHANNILQTSLDDFSCSFVTNTHNSNQWWTVKSVEHPYIGSKIQNGEKIYLENHVYHDLIQYVPCRLTHNNGELKTEAIIKKGCDNLFWTIEKL